MKLIRLKDVIGCTSLSRSTIYKILMKVFFLSQYHQVIGPWHGGG
ncbi:AlpA family phage regulatory protein [Shewanella baltica]